MLPLALGISIDFFLISRIIVGETTGLYDDGRFGRRISVALVYPSAGSWITKDCFRRFAIIIAGCS
jgi:hypothetical protein